MDRLSKDQAASWASRLGVDVSSRRAFFLEAPGFMADLSQPQPSRALAVTSREIARAFQEAKTTLLWITEWGIWPTEESWQLFRRAMLGYQDGRTLAEAPAFLFSRDENEDLRDLVRLAMISGWGGYILASRSHLAFSLTHDDWFGVSGSSKVLVSEWCDEYMKSNTGSAILWSNFISAD